MAKQNDLTLLLMFYFDGQFPWNIPLLLYYPAGVIYKVPFRYEKRWIKPSLQDENIYPLQEALIVMKFSELDRGDLQEYIPIRKVTITKCQKLGDYYYLYMRLGDFVLFGESGLGQFSKTFRTKLAKRDQRLLVMPVDFDPQLEFVSSADEKKDIENWFRLAKFFSSKFTPRMEAYENTAFLKFHAVVSSSNRVIHPSPVYKKLSISILQWLGRNFAWARSQLKSLYNGIPVADIWGYKLKVSESYAIKVVQFFHPDETLTFIPEEANLFLDIPKDSFFISRQINPIIGHQDILLFSFTTTDYRPMTTSLVIKPQEGYHPTFRVRNKNEKHPLTIPDINLQVQVNHTIPSILWIYILPIVVFLLGSLFITASTSNVLSIPLITPLIKGITKDDATTRAIQLAIGLAIQAVGLYIIKRDKQ